MSDDQTSTLPSSWTQRYLTLLGVERAEPSLDYLTELNRAQLTTVLFENVTSILRRAAKPTGPLPPIDLDVLLANWESKRGGGVCFELAPMFGRLLTELGFETTPILGQISFPGSHQALIVTMDEARFLVDVSNGAPFFSPISLVETTRIEAAGLAYRFRAGDSTDEWVQERNIHDEWTPFCRYNLRPADQATREYGYQEHQVLGQTWVTNRVRLIRCSADSIVSLNDDEVTCFSDEGKETFRLESINDLPRLAAERFGAANLPIAEAAEYRFSLDDTTSRS